MYSTCNNIMSVSLLCACIIVQQDANGQPPPAVASVEKKVIYTPVSQGTRFTYDYCGKPVVLEVLHSSSHDGVIFAKQKYIFNDTTSREDMFCVTSRLVLLTARGGDLVVPPACIMMNSDKKGDSWVQEEVEGAFAHRAVHTIRETVVVEVKAGKYNCVKVHTLDKVKGSTREYYSWYAADVGLVKETVVNEMGESVSKELVKIDIKK